MMCVLPFLLVKAPLLISKEGWQSRMCGIDGVVTVFRIIFDENLHQWSNENCYEINKLTRFFELNYLVGYEANKDFNTN